MKMKLVVIVVLLGIIGIGGYKTYEILQKEESTKEEVAVPVTLLTIDVIEVEENLIYEGRVAPKLLEKISFKSTARLSMFNGEVGQTIESGTVLVALDQGDLQLALDAAESQLKAASAEYQRANKGARNEDIELANLNVEKATVAVSYLTKKVIDLKTLVDEGLATQNDLDGLTLELDLARKDQELAQKNYEKALKGTESELIRAAKAQVELAETNKSAKVLMIEDATYTLSENRILVERFYEAGELVPAGYPVAIVRSESLSVNLGVTVKDLEKVYVGQKVRIDSTNSSAQGEVVRIAEIPDEAHFLYELEVSIKDNLFKVGEIVTCKLFLGKKEVIKVPISAILNDGIDYVYITQGTLATMKKIEIIGTEEGFAYVTGLSIGDTIIISNLNRIHEQSKILVEE
jgi:HlyD family secretion protein